MRSDNITHINVTIGIEKILEEKEELLHVHTTPPWGQEVTGTIPSKECQSQSSFEFPLKEQLCKTVFP